MSDGPVGFVDFASQALDADVDDVRHGFKRRIPDVLGNLRSADHLVGVQHEMLQQRILTRGERSGPAHGEDPPGPRVQFERDLQSGSRALAAGVRGE